MTYMNNGKGVFSLDDMTYRYDQLQFLPGHCPAKRCWIFWDLQKPNLKQKEQHKLKYSFVQLLIPTLLLTNTKKIIIYQLLVVWLTCINNNRKIIGLHATWSTCLIGPPEVSGNFFWKRPFSQQSRRVVKLPIFMVISRQWTLKWHNSRIRQKFFTLLDIYFVQNLSWYPTFLKNFAIFCKFLHLIYENWDFFSIWDYSNEEYAICENICQ